MPIILGVDPGTNVTGYALLNVKQLSYQLLCTGTIVLKSESDPFTKLGKLANRIEEIISEYRPEILSIESPFVGKNIQSAIKVGRAQGVVIGVCASNQLQIFEYAPKQVKLAVCGNGNASKTQVELMLRLQLKLSKPIESEDASDALALAYCHANNVNNPVQNSTNKKAKSWSDFASNNPDRLKSK